MRRILRWTLDSYVHTILNNEYGNSAWFITREDGAPMVGVNYTEDLPHGRYPVYADIAWDWAKSFSRDITTGAIVYNPNAK